MKRPFWTRRRRLPAGILLIGIVAGVGIGLRQVHQGKLDAALLSAIQVQDAQTAIDLLDQGADANASIGFGSPGPPKQMFRDLLGLLTGHRPPQRSYTVCALTLVYMSPHSKGPFPKTDSRPAGAPLPPVPTLSFATGFGSPGRPGRIALVGALLKHGADPNRHPGYSTPLYYAVHLRHADEVKLLLEHGANPNTFSGVSTSPLFEADLACTELLLKHGADVNVRFRFGETPLMIAASTFRRMHGDRERLAKLDLLLRHGADVNARDKYGQTALMHTASADAADAARMLLDHGAEVDARANSGATALMMACARRSPELPILLLQRGARASATDNRGRRARTYASTYGYFPSTSKLCRLLAAAETAERGSSNGRPTVAGSAN